MHRFFVKIIGQNNFHTATRFDLPPVPQGLIEVFAHAIANGLHIDKLRRIETVQVQFERFALNDVRTFSRHCDVRQRHLRLAFEVKPRQFKSGPQISAKENGRSVNAQLFTLHSARNREQQRRIVLIHIRAVFAQLRLFGLVHTTPFTRRRNTHRFSSDADATKP